MKPPRFIRLGIAASAIGHLSALAAVLVYAEVHPFNPVDTDPVAVDIVLPENAAPAPEPPAPSVPPPDSFDLSSKPVPAVQPPPQPPQQPTPQPKQQPKQPAGPKQAAVPPPVSPVPPALEPDLSIKYHVQLGLPASAEAGGFDAPAKTADIASGLVAEFRRHLKACSTLPKSVAPSDAIKIVLRVFMMPDGHLAREPVLVEASASAKGPALMQSAIDALETCQPYAMLPVDRYGEWKVLDLSFTPQDFTGG